MNPDQVPNNSRDDERTRDKERKTKKPRERDKDNKDKNSYEDSGGTNRETSREMMTTRQTNVQPNGRFPGFSFLIYLFRLLSGSVTATRFIKEFIAAINGNQENRLVRFTNYPSFDREGPNENLNFSIYFAPICPQTRNVPATFSLGYPCLLNRIGLVFPKVFRTSDNWKFTFARTAMTTNLTFCQLWMYSPASTSQTSSPDIVVPAFAENEDSNMMAARGRNFPRVVTRARETSALLYQLFRLITSDSFSEETLQQLINTVQRVLQCDGNSAINIIAGVVPALALGDNQQTTMFGVVYARGMTYGTVPRIPAVSSPCGENSFLDDMAANDLRSRDGAERDSHTTITENFRYRINAGAVSHYAATEHSGSGNGSGLMHCGTDTKEVRRSDGVALDSHSNDNENFGCRVRTGLDGHATHINDIWSRDVAGFDTKRVGVRNGVKLLRNDTTREEGGCRDGAGLDSHVADTTEVGCHDGAGLDSHVADTTEVGCHDGAGLDSHVADTTEVGCHDGAGLDSHVADTTEVGCHDGAGLDSHAADTTEVGCHDGAGLDSHVADTTEVGCHDGAGLDSHVSDTTEVGCHDGAGLDSHVAETRTFECQNIVDSSSSDTDEFKCRDGARLDSHSTNPVDCGYSEGKGANHASNSNDFRHCNVAAPKSQTTEPKELGCRTAVGINTHPTDTEDHWNLRGARNLEMLESGCEFPVQSSGCRTAVGINTHPTDTEDHWNLRGARNLQVMESGCEFPVQLEDARVNGCVEETNNGVNHGGARKAKVKGTNLGHSIQCEEDLQLAPHHAVAGPTSVDHANGHPYTGSLATDRRRLILQMRVNRAHLVAQCEEDLSINTVWLQGEEEALLGRDWWCLLCKSSPWRIVLGQCEHFFCSSCYRGQQKCPICRSI